jgi:DNA-3-methyladenine glycosylase
MPLTLLPRSFYARDPRTVARALLGKLMVRDDGRGKQRIGRIVETEAYHQSDPASHSYIGPTPRNQVMFGPAGYAYVYFTYGMHYCMNVVCQQEGEAGAVLLRAMEPLEGIAAMAKARGIELPAQPTTKQLRFLTSGPARLAQAFSITRDRDNGADITRRVSNLGFVDDSAPVGKVIASTRIGITKATEKKWRYMVAGNPFVSK